MAFDDNLIYIKIKTVSRSGLLVVGALLTLAAAVLTSKPAHALPSFARQTGQPCGACHTDFPQLTPFGRRFKIGGYTLGGGDNKVLGQGGWVPPLSMMIIGDWTHTETPTSGPSFGPSSLHNNDNSTLNTVSLFYGGAITDHIGAFIQGTYNGPVSANPGPPPNSSAQYLFHWDNTDVRVADTTKIGGIDVLYGLDFNNSPTVSDPWNTTPAWSWPFQSSPYMAAAGPAFTPATTILDGPFAQHVIGAGGYLWINDMLYIEAEAYKSTPSRLSANLGIDPNVELGSIDAFAPYWRVAFEPSWGPNTWEVGTFGMSANVNPSPLVFFGSAGTDHYTDIGFDSQYQFHGDNFWVTLKALYIHEQQTYSASSVLGLTSNSSDTLQTFRAQASISYGDNNKVVFTGGYFNTWGTSDALLYSTSATGSPNTDGWVAEVAYIPYGTGSPEIWPWFNARLGLQYVWYDKFFGASTNYDGLGTNARDNNALYAYAWIAF